MNEIGQNEGQTARQAPPYNEGQGMQVEKPMAVWVFGLGNIVIGCYFLVRMSYGWSRIIADTFKNFEKVTWAGGISTLLTFVLGAGLEIWLIVLGIGLLTMKRWARRGSVLYGWIQVVLIVIGLGATVITLSRMTLPEGFWKTFLTIGDAIMLVHWIYMVLLLIFMKTAKVKRAFAAVE
jgi:hypothetical protein